MTEQDRAGIPAKESEFRAWNPRTRDIVYLQAPEIIKHFPDYILQRKSENGNWDTFLLPESDSDASEPSTEN